MAPSLFKREGGLIGTGIFLIYQNTSDDKTEGLRDYVRTRTAAIWEVRRLMFFIVQLF
ncbi:MAG: hypothetical protein ACQEWG_13725 [Bacteroidota bacterium]